MTPHDPPDPDYLATEIRRGFRQWQRLNTTNPAALTTRLNNILKASDGNTSEASARALIEFIEETRPT